MDTRDKMTREISKVVSFAISGLSELLALQMYAFMQLLQERNSQHEQLNSLLFDRNNISLCT